MKHFKNDQKEVPKILAQYAKWAKQYGDCERPNMETKKALEDQLLRYVEEEKISAGGLDELCKRINSVHQYSVWNGLCKRRPYSGAVKKMLEIMAGRNVPPALYLLTSAYMSGKHGYEKNISIAKKCFEQLQRVEKKKLLSSCEFTKRIKKKWEKHPSLKEKMQADRKKQTDIPQAEKSLLTKMFGFTKKKGSTIEESPLSPPSSDTRI